jgi:hypothetical protein
LQTPAVVADGVSNDHLVGEQSNTTEQGSSLELMFALNEDAVVAYRRVCTCSEASRRSTGRK